MDPMDLNLEPLGMEILTLDTPALFTNMLISEVMNNNCTTVALLPPAPCAPPPPLAPAPQPGLSPQPSSPKGSGKAQPCPHCHREFTNLRHHINQQHMQVIEQVVTIGGHDIHNFYILKIVTFSLCILVNQKGDILRKTIIRLNFHI